MSGGGGRGRGGGGGRARGGVEQFPDAGDEGLGFLGLDDEVVGADGKGKVAVASVGVGGGVEGEGDVAEGGVALPFAAEGEAVHDGHEDVGNDEIGAGCAGGRQAFAAVGGFGDGQAGALQQEAQEVAVLLLVVHDQNEGLVHGDSLGGRKRSMLSTNVSGSMGFSR